jgi:hypothetical protein
MGLILCPDHRDCLARAEYGRVMFRGKFRLLQSMQLAAQKSSALRSSHMAVKGAAPGLAGGDARAGRGVRVRIRLR